MAHPILRGIKTELLLHLRKLSPVSQNRHSLYSADKHQGSTLQPTKGLTLFWSEISLSYSRTLLDKVSNFQLKSFQD